MGWWAGLDICCYEIFDFDQNCCLSKYGFLIKIWIFNQNCCLSKHRFSIKTVVYQNMNFQSKHGFSIKTVVYQNMDFQSKPLFIKINGLEQTNIFKQQNGILAKYFSEQTDTDKTTDSNYIICFEKSFISQNYKICKNNIHCHKHNIAQSTDLKQNPSQTKT